MKTKPNPNPLLQLDFSPGEWELIDLFAKSVKQHHHELKPHDEMLWLGFDIREVVKLNSYDNVLGQLNKLMNRKIVETTGSIGSRRNVITPVISKAWMEEENGLLLISINQSLIQFFLQVADIPQKPKMKEIICYRIEPETSESFKVVGEKKIKMYI